MQNNRAVGSSYERQAADYLKSCGFRIAAINYRIRQAEIDIVAYDGKYLVFVEVKYRKDAHAGHPLEAVTPAKAKKLCRAALAYIGQHHISTDDTPIRFDVIGILGSEITHVKNAFDFCI